MIKKIISVVSDFLVLAIGHIIDGLRIQGKVSSRNLHAILWQRAVADSADFVETYSSEVMIFHKRELIWKYVLEKLRHDQGLCLEFGVFKGHSINFFAKRLVKLKFIGFDGFEGLKEDWIGHHTMKGAFNARGVLPKVPENVELVKGWFHETWLNKYSNLIDFDQVRLIHIDSDTYEAAVTVLSGIKSLKPGILILFDNYLGYPNWRNSEHKAWLEFQKRTGIKFKYIAFSNEQALIEIHDS